MLEQEIWNEVSLLVREEDFYKPAHRQIYAAITDLNKGEQPADLVTVTNWLMEKKVLHRAGEAAYLAEIMEQTPSTANVLTYARIVKEKSFLRNLIQVTSDFVERAYQQDFADLESFTNEVEAGVFKLTESQESGGGY